MRWVDLRTGYSCNQRCRFCDQGDRRDTFADVSLDALATTLREAHPGGEAGVWLAGGEVTTRRDLPALVSAARAAGYARVGIQTNGRILAAAGAAAALRQRGLTDAIVAIHAPSAPIHDHLTGVPGSFVQATAGARRVVEAGVTLHVATVMTRSTTEVLPAIAALAARLGARSHRWIMARAQGSALSEERALIPRWSLLTGPLTAALDLERDRRIEAETVGIPLCLLGAHRAVAADRTDALPPVRAFPAGLEEAPPPRTWAPPCEGCPLRPACPGPLQAYVARYGSDELAPPPPLPGVALPVPGPHVVAITASTTARLARQALVRAAASPARGLVFAAPSPADSPWAHPRLPGLVRDAARLGFTDITVRGPLGPLAALEPAVAEKLGGLSAVESPGGDDAGRAWLARHLPGCVVRG